MAGEITTHLDRLKESFLWAAAKGGRLQECASLLDLGALPDWTSPTPRRRTNNGIISTSSSLDRHQNYDDEDTPLLVAVRSGHADVASLLLAHGADPTKIGRGRNNILHLAAARGDEDLCRLLLSNLESTLSVGRLLQQKNIDGKTPLQVVAEENGCLHIAAIMAQWVDQSYYEEDENEEDDSNDVEQRDIEDASEDFSSNSVSMHDNHELHIDNDASYDSWDDQHHNDAVSIEDGEDSFHDGESSSDDNIGENDSKEEDDEENEEESQFSREGAYDSENDRPRTDSRNESGERKNEEETEHNDGNYDDDENIFPIHRRLRSMVVIKHPLNDHNRNQADDNIMNKHYSQEEEGCE